MGKGSSNQYKQTLPPGMELPNIPTLAGKKILIHNWEKVGSQTDDFLFTLSLSVHEDLIVLGFSTGREIFRRQTNTISSGQVRWETELRDWPCGETASTTNYPRDYLML